MNQESKSVLSKNNIRRMEGWARGMHPNEWHGRCAVVTEYLAQLEDDQVTVLVSKGWAAVFAAAERDWPEAFEAWNNKPQA